MVKSPSSRRAWVEIIVYDGEELLGGSPSSRRAWVEIVWARGHLDDAEVALLAEGVGRNVSVSVAALKLRMVALLAEGVGRNFVCFLQLI